MNRDHAHITRVKRENPTVAFLKQAIRGEKRIEKLLERADRYEDLATRATSRLTAERVSGTGRRSNVEESVVMILDLSQEVRDRAKSMVNVIREIEQVIEKINNDKYKDVLSWRYLNGDDWVEVADCLGVEQRWAFELHGKALLEFEKNHRGMQ